jgi:hypothetical protein
MGNRFRDALKVGELSAGTRDNAEPSSARRRCRDWTGAACVAANRDMVKAQSGPQTDAVAKAIVVRKSVAREGVPVRIRVIPHHSCGWPMRDASCDVSTRF